jgi:hypothetical protein
VGFRSDMQEEEYWSWQYKIAEEACSRARDGITQGKYPFPNPYVCKRHSHSEVWLGLQKELLARPVKPFHAYTLFNATIVVMVELWAIALKYLQVTMPGG